MNSPPVPSSFCLLVRRHRHDQLAPRLSASHMYRPSSLPCMRRHAHRKISGEHLAFRDYADLFWLSCARPVPLLSVLASSSPPLAALFLSNRFCFVEARTLHMS